MPIMPRFHGWVRTSLEVIGAITVIVGICGLVIWGVFSVKSFHRECGSKYDFYFVYLNTGNSNPGYEYTPIVELRDLAPGSASFTWDSPDQISMTYPSSATVVEAYAKVLDVRVVMHPSVP